MGHLLLGANCLALFPWLELPHLNKVTAALLPPLPPRNPWMGATCLERWNQSCEHELVSG